MFRKESHEHSSRTLPVGNTTDLTERLGPILYVDLQYVDIVDGTTRGATYSVKIPYFLSHDQKLAEAYALGHVVSETDYFPESLQFTSILRDND